MLLAVEGEVFFSPSVWVGKLPEPEKPEFEPEKSESEKLER